VALFDIREYKGVIGLPSNTRTHFPMINVGEHESAVILVLY